MLVKGFLSRATIFHDKLLFHIYNAAGYYRGIKIGFCGSWVITDGDNTTSGDYYTMGIMDYNDETVYSIIRCNGREYDGPGNCLYACFLHWNMEFAVEEKTAHLDVGSIDVIYI